MTRLLLCAGPTLLVISKNGVLFYRRPGGLDVPVPYAPENYPVFFQSAKHKFDLSRVIGPDGEEGPSIPDETSIPELQGERLSSGEMVYRLLAKHFAPTAKSQSGYESAGSGLANPSNEIVASR